MTSPKGLAGVFTINFVTKVRGNTELRREQEIIETVGQENVRSRVGKPQDSQFQLNNPNRLGVKTEDSLHHAQRFLIPRNQRRGFLLKFTLMTILGWVVGGIVSIALEKTILESLPTDGQQQTWYSLGRYFSSVLFALVFAADQALVIRKYISGKLWMLATAFGWLISNSVSTAWINYISYIALSLHKSLSSYEIIGLGLLSTMSYVLSGVWLGICQWLVLRRYVARVWWWNFLPPISFLLISILIWLVSQVQQFIPLSNRVQIVYLTGQGLTALILGVIPAIGLCTLKKKLS
ncbi:hypothetical protein [Iningainema tapete]|uniref:hypothetical protein n=1 Tax=Iningainema tapete TaxID=2806730 RepID=UPI003080DC5B